MEDLENDNRLPGQEHEQEEHVCRICRCEAFDDNPLFHPCKCRGSIKFIHQDCLDSWLEFSKKKTCDICHAPYSFAFELREDTPKVVPFTLILKDIVSTIKSLLVPLAFSITILAAGIICPMAFGNCLFGFNWLLGCDISDVVDESYWKQIRLGNLTFVSGDEESLGNILGSTVLTGWMYLLVLAAILFTFVSARSWVTTDDGFEKIMNKRIGREITNTAEILRNLQRNVANDANIRRGLLNPQNREEQIARDLFLVLNADPNVRARENHEDLLRALNIPVQNVNEQHPIQEEGDDHEQLEDPFPDPAPPFAPPAFNNNPNFNPNFNAVPNAQRVPPNVNIDFNAGFDNDANVPPAAGGRNNNLILELSPISALLVTFVILLGMLSVMFLIYYIPALVGLLTINGAYLINTSVWNLFMLFLGRFNLKYSLIPYSSPMLQNEYCQAVCAYSLELIQSYREILDRALKFAPKATVFEIGQLLVIGYTNAFIVLSYGMSLLESGCSSSNPLRGQYRTLYSIMLEIQLTLKVVTIFFIELIAFPIFCGYQIHLVIHPLVVGPEGSWFSITNFNPLNAFSLAVEWLLGTLFMYYFASFVSMIRASILRKGVLFFIRSPDDPNVRLVHDALIKPFGLQISRILMSAGVYTIYIILELGIWTWGAGYFLGTGLLRLSLIYNTPLVLAERFFHKTYSKALKMFWIDSFEKGCQHLRLTSFMLGGDANEERGHIVYRNPLRNYLPSFLFRSVDLDSFPVVEECDVAKAFKENQAAQGVFVTDGYFVRAPDNDSVSRAFIKKLFVKVTETDRLLEQPKEVTKEEEERINPYGDEELVPITTHTVVYRPPLFITRIFAFLGYLWFVSVTWTLGLVLTFYALGQVFITTLASALAFILPTLSNSVFPFVSKDQAGFFEYVALKLAVGFYIFSVGLSVFIHLIEKKDESLSGNIGLTKAASFVLEEVKLLGNNGFVKAFGVVLKEINSRTADVLANIKYQTFAFALTLFSFTTISTLRVCSVELYATVSNHSDQQGPLLTLSAGYFVLAVVFSILNYLASMQEIIQVYGLWDFLFRNVPNFDESAHQCAKKQAKIISYFAAAFCFITALVLFSTTAFGYELEPWLMNRFVPDQARFGGSALSATILSYTLICYAYQVRMAWTFIDVVVKIIRYYHNDLKIKYYTKGRVLVNVDEEET